MRSCAKTESLADVLDDLVAEAVSHDIPPDLADEARAATLGVLTKRTDPVGVRTRRRAAAYFAAVVERRVWRRGNPPRAAARAVVASVISDLRDSGRRGDDIWDELQRGWAEMIPRDLLDEYRTRLCA